ncbi:hypothetical protein V8G54_023670, partial [Vigna mungo]
EKIEAYESKTLVSQESNLDSLAHALGIQKHCRWVCGLGLRPCLSKFFGVNGRSHSGSSTSSYVEELQTQINKIFYQYLVSNQGSVPKNECNEEEQNYTLLMNIFLSYIFSILI